MSGEIINRLSQNDVYMFLISYSNNVKWHCIFYFVSDEGILDCMLRYIHLHCLRTILIIIVDPGQDRFELNIFYNKYCDFDYARGNNIHGDF